jgi:hypothetical protein
MSNVIRFVTRKVDNDSKEKAPITSDCRILIFPGIRYSRHEIRNTDKKTNKKYKKIISKNKQLAIKDGSS